MKIIILKTQSFSDIITNSSSELFVVKGDRYSSAFEDFLYVENIGDLQWYLERKEVLLPEIRKYLKNPPKTICDRLDIDDYRNALREAIKNNDLDWGKIAFGAHFYNSLLNQNKIKCYLYPPESLSKNLLLDNTIKVTPSSFNLNPIKEIKYEYM
jgi:hypothetical protein